MPVHISLLHQRDRVAAPFCHQQRAIRHACRHLRGTHFTLAGRDRNCQIRGRHRRRFCGPLCIHFGRGIYTRNQHCAYSYEYSHSSDTTDNPEGTSAVHLAARGQHIERCLSIKEFTCTSRLVSVGSMAIHFEVHSVSAFAVVSRLARKNASQAMISWLFTAKSPRNQFRRHTMPVSNRFR